MTTLVRIGGRIIKKEVVGVSLMAQIADRLAGFSLRRMHKRGNTVFPKYTKPFP